jgi:hypothetical protein
LSAGLAVWPIHKFTTQPPENANFASIIATSTGKITFANISTALPSPPDSIPLRSNAKVAPFLTSSIQKIQKNASKHTLLAYAPIKNPYTMTIRMSVSLVPKIQYLIRLHRNVNQTKHRILDF